MKFDVPKITKKFRLSDYAPEFDEAEITVWVNPPAKLLQKYDQLLADGKAIRKEIEGNPDMTAPRQADIQGRLDDMIGEMYTVFAELWSAGPETTRWTVEEVKEMAEGTRETDPQFWTWIRERSIMEIRGHRLAIKKG